MMTTIPLTDLKAGDVFKFSNGRKHHKVLKVIELGHGEFIPKEHKGKNLIILDTCKQLIATNTEVHLVYKGENL